MYPHGPHGVTGSPSEMGRRAQARVEDFLRTHTKSVATVPGSCRDTPNRVPPMLSAASQDELARRVARRVVVRRGGDQLRRDELRQGPDLQGMLARRVDPGRTGHEDPRAPARRRRHPRGREGPRLLRDPRRQGEHHPRRRGGRHHQARRLLRRARAVRSGTPERHRHRDRQAAARGAHPTRVPRACSRRRPSATTSSPAWPAGSTSSTARSDRVGSSEARAATRSRRARRPSAPRHGSRGARGTRARRSACRPAARLRSARSGPTTDGNPSTPMSPSHEISSM